MSVTIRTLANGLRVVNVRHDHLQSATVAAFVNVGARHESPDLNGISHFLEHMAFKGTKTKDAFQIMADIEMLGADVNAYTSKDKTAYYVSGRGKDLPVFVELLGDILLNSIFPENELETEREVIVQEFHKYQDMPRSIASYLYSENVYRGQALGRKTIGELANINTFTRQNLIDYMNAHYTGPNIIIGVVGNFHDDEVIDLVIEHFYDVPSGTTNRAQDAFYTGGVGVHDAQFKQTQILLGFKTVGTLDELHYHDVVAATLLGDGMSSPLFAEIREKRGLVYTVGAGVDIEPETGTMFIHAGTTPEHLGEFFNVTCDLIVKHTTSVDPNDLQRAKNQLSVSAMRRSERPFRTLEALVEDLFVYGKPIEIEEVVAKFDAVTANDVMASFERALLSTPTLAMCGAGANEQYYHSVKERIEMIR